jgi:hypothetical protein
MYPSLSLPPTDPVLAWENALLLDAIISGYNIENIENIESFNVLEDE